jgi:hypothetical protein
MTEEAYNQVPDAIPATVVFAAPNENVMLHEGSYQMKQYGQTLEVEGQIRFTWFPLIKIIFSGTVISGGEANLNHLEELELLIAGVPIGTGLLYHRKLPGENRPYTFEGHSFHCTIGPASTPVGKIRFMLPNMRELFGKEICDTVSGNHQDGRFFFEDDDYKITIDKLVNFADLWQLLRTKGGFMLLYSGKLEKKSGSFLVSDLKDYLFSVAHFLYLLNGQRTAPLFLEAGDGEGTIFRDYPCHNIQIYKQNGCWSDFQWFDDLSPLWQAFRKLWVVDKDRDFLMTVLHWYVEANSGAAFIEGSIILAQTALELLFNWFIVEKKGLISKKDAKKKSAEENIRLLLTTIQGSLDIPPACEELLQLKDITDGPHALTKIRNALVHGDEYKRVNFLMEVDYNAKYQALKLARWYIELTLLYILGYQGRYFNTAFRVNENVPWAKPGQVI